MNSCPEHLFGGSKILPCPSDRWVSEISDVLSLHPYQFSFILFCAQWRGMKSKNNNSFFSKYLYIYLPRRARKGNKEHLYKIDHSGCSLVPVRWLFISSAHAGWINHRNDCLTNAQPHSFSFSNQDTSRQCLTALFCKTELMGSACSLTTQYQQTCFRLLFSTEDYIAIKISTWCQCNAKFKHNLHVIPSATYCIPQRGTQSSCCCFWPFCVLLKEALQENAALRHWCISSNGVKTGHSLMCFI